MKRGAKKVTDNHKEARSGRRLVLRFEHGAVDVIDDIDDILQDEGFLIANDYDYDTNAEYIYAVNDDRVVLGQIGAVLLREGFVFTIDVI